MPFEPVHIPPAPVHPVPVDPTGRRGPTKAQAAGPGWRWVARNRYVPACVDRKLVQQRIAEAAVHLPPTGAVSGWAALWLLGAAYFDGSLHGRELPVLLSLGHGRGRRTPDGVALSYEPIDQEEVFEIHGLRVLHPRRALFDDMRRHDDWRDAVVSFDMTAAARLTSRARMERFCAEHASWRRSGGAARALAHGDEYARSPRETRLRLLWTVDAGLPAPHVNRTIRGCDGALVCVPDLFDEEAGLVVEYDGEDHRERTRHAADAGRYERCRELALEYCMVTGPDMSAPTTVVRRLLGARQRLLFLPPSDRRWVIAPRDTEPLDAYLDRRERFARELWEQRGVRIVPW